MGMESISNAELESLPQNILDALDDDEPVLWQGIPEQGFRLSTVQIVFMIIGVVPTLIILALGICGIASALYTLRACADDLARFVPSSCATSYSDSVYNWFLCIPFVYMSYVLFLRPFHEVWGRKKTIYVLTNSRVLIAGGVLFPRVQSIDLAALPIVTYSKRVEGPNSILLGHIYSATSLWHAGTIVSYPPTLDGIDDAEQVYKLIQDIRGESNQSAPTPTA